MYWKEDTEELSGRKAHIWQPQPVQDSPPLLVAFADEQAVQAALKQLENPLQRGACKPFVLALYEAEDWNSEYTPWPAPAPFAKEPAFSGGGGETLAWLENDLLPYVRKTCNTSDNPRDNMLLGYSLGGLFALWAWLESEEFTACASCSGSLWYEGWWEYAQGKTPPSGSRVYLSLGEKEEKARNPKMAAVGDATRSFAAWLQTAPGVEQSVFAWHPGGHFNEVPHRLTAAVEWLMQTWPADNTQ